MKENTLNFVYSLFDFKKNNNRLQLLWVIAAHLFCWVLFFSLPLLFYRIRFVDAHFFYKELVNKFFLILFFYFNYFFLVPRFFFKKKWGLYALLLLLSIGLLLAQHLIVEKYFSDHLHQSFASLRYELSHRHPLAQYYFGRDGLPPGYRQLISPANEPKIFHIPSRAFFLTIRDTLSSSFLLVLIGGFIHLAFSFIKNQDEKRALENAQLHAEVHLLKSQINPHFLFNTLNSIYTQAYQKSPHTQQSILKLSEILRYMIYDTTSESIALEKDIHYLASYIDLQRLRLPKKVAIHYKVEGSLSGLYIAPLLLITFVENAFKHGISYAQPSAINIAITVVDKTLTLVVSNPLITNNTFAANGIGLKNAKRRLELLYPHQYTLAITEEHNLYTVHLKI